MKRCSTLFTSTN